MKQVIITGKAHPLLIDRLEETGYDVLYLPSIAYDELGEIIPSAAGIVVTTRITVDKNLIDKGASLEWVGRLGNTRPLFSCRRECGFVV